jgi:hypothetical protein
MEPVWLWKKKEGKRKEVPLPETRLVEKTNSPCRHTNTYEEELTYSQEQNGAYCKKGFYLCGLKCRSGCGVNFVASGKEDDQCRPGGSNPVLYCCVNMKGARRQGIRKTIPANTSFVTPAGKRE